MNEADASVPAAVAAAADAIAAAIDDDRGAAGRGRPPDLRRAPEPRAGSPRSTPPSASRRSRPIRDRSSPWRQAPGRTRRPLAGRRRGRRRCRHRERWPRSRVRAATPWSGQRERPHAVRPRRGRGGGRRGRADRVPRLAPGSELAALVDHEIAVVVGPGGARRLDAAQGRHGAEARPEHDLDRRRWSGSARRSGT